MTVIDMTSPEFVASGCGHTLRNPVVFHWGVLYDVLYLSRGSGHLRRVRGHGLRCALRLTAAGYIATIVNPRPPAKPAG